MRLPFLARPPQTWDESYDWEEAVAAKTLSVSAAITQNPAGAPTPQAIMIAVAEALDNPVFNTAAPWTAVVTITSS